MNAERILAVAEDRYRMCRKETLELRQTVAHKDKVSFQLPRSGFGGLDVGKRRRVEGRCGTSWA